MRSGNGLQEELDHLSDEIKDIEVLRETAVSHSGPFPDFLRKLHKASRSKNGRSTDFWSSLGQAFNSGLLELRPDVGTAVAEEVRLGTFSRENFEGLCRQLGIILVLKIAKISRMKIRSEHRAAEGKGDEGLKRVWGGPGQKAADAYERVKRPNHPNLRLVV